ncbi:hypothetical protein [Erythrobacter alti]|uniref:hypothetical protein n=1 Tax=Erythrobacter alti TaxID=1896145 RepID=UPI0030F420DF
MKIPTSPADLASWNRLAWDGAKLWMEASSVIWLRSMRLAQGGKPAENEAQRMVSEKLNANWELGWKMLGAAGASPQSNARRSVNHYRRKVRANQRRLTGK